MGEATSVCSQPQAPGVRTAVCLAAHRTRRQLRSVRIDHTGCQDSRSPRFPGRAQGVDFSPELCQLGPRHVGQALVPPFSIGRCLFQDSVWLQIPGHSSPSQTILRVRGSSGRSVLLLLLVESADKDAAGVEGRLCI